MHTTVQEDLLNGNENEEFMRTLGSKIVAPTLIVWGEHDRVRCVCVVRACVMM